MTHPKTDRAWRLHASYLAALGAAVALVSTTHAEPPPADAPTGTNTPGRPPGGVSFGDGVIATAGPEAARASAEAQALFPPGTCDAVYEFRFFGAGGPGTSYLIKPGGEYQPSIRFDAPWGDEPVQAIDIRPLIDNPKVTHHYVLSMASLSGDDLFDALDVWGPGRQLPVLPADVGIGLPHGPGTIDLNFHYYNLVGNDTVSDRSGVAVCVVRGTRLRAHTAVQTKFGAVASPMVPANTRGHVVTGTCKPSLSEPATLLSVWPHAHKHGRHVSLKVTKADGRVVTLREGAFSFTEQAIYELEPPYVVEPGDVFTTTCTFDNDSNQSVFFGEETDKEMCGVFALTYPSGALACVPASDGSR